MNAEVVASCPQEVDGKFRFVVLVVQRARQIKNGSRPRVDGGTHKPLWIAMREVMGGHVSWGLEEEKPRREPAQEQRHGR